MKITPSFKVRRNVNIAGIFIKLNAKINNTHLNHLEDFAEPLSISFNSRQWVFLKAFLSFQISIVLNHSSPSSEYGFILNTIYNIQ